MNNRALICPECQKEDKKSCVYVGCSSTTAMANAPFYDEDGKYHSGNTNTVTTRYMCSNGHAWSERYKENRHD